MNVRTIIVGLMLVVLAAGPAQADALLASDALPNHAKTLQGTADIVEFQSENLLKIDQQSDRAVLRWNSFDIGKDAGVHFSQPDRAAAALNIVDANTSSILAGKLSSDGSVFLINPHGITVTPDGIIDTGGAFVASTLAAVDVEEFMNGSNTLVFRVPEGGHADDVLNQGTITAQDVLLLGSRVENAGTITARLGRVALGSASHATLDLTGDGFLQVLAPADVVGGGALVTNSGIIEADGGLVQLKAATRHEAFREAVHMPGEVRAHSVSGRDGAIVFSGGEGGGVTVSGTVDASPDPDQGGTDGGFVRIEGTVVDLDFEGVHLGAGGHFALAADLIEIDTKDSHYMLGATRIVEGLNEGDIGDLLRAGVNVTLHGNDSIVWRTGLMIAEEQLAAEAAGKAGDVHLLAGRAIEIGSGLYSTGNSDWKLSVNAKPVSGIQLGDQSAYIDMFTGSGEWARFANHGHLTIEMLHGEDSAGLEARGIELPVEFSGRALTAHIPAGIANYDDAYITIRGNVEAADAITLSGHLQIASQETGVTTLQGQRVTWTTEQTDRLVGSSLLRFKEGDVVTRFGRGAAYSSDAGYIDATRLILGSEISVSRLYGEPDPEANELWNMVFHLAPHNKVLPGHGANVDGIFIEGIPKGGIPLTNILSPGSIAVEGPGVKGQANAGSGDAYHYLRLVATDQIAFAPLEFEWRQVGEYQDLFYVSGAAGGYWIDFSDASELASRVPLIIERRPLTVEMLNPSYAYGSLHESLLKLDGVVNDDDVIPTGQLRLITDGDETDDTVLTYVRLGDGFGLDFRLGRGDYAYSVTGLVGERASNYVLNLNDLADGSLHISPRLLSYRVSGDVTVTYGDLAELPSASLDAVLSGDDVAAVIGLFRNGQLVENHDRLGVGRYDLKVTALSGEDAHNYVLTSGDDRTLRVQPREVTWSVADTTSVYGTMATFDVTLHGVLQGDDVTGRVRLRDVDEPLSARTDSGFYYTVVDSLQGVDSGNYTLTDWKVPGNKAGGLTIQPKNLSLDASPFSIVYGDISGGRYYGENPLPRLLGVLTGDQVTLKPSSVQRIKVGESHGPDLMDIGVGNYELRVVVDDDYNEPLEGPNSHNYVLSSELATIPMTVTPRPVTVRALDTDAVYGTLAFPGYEIEGALGEVFGRVTVWSGDELVDYDYRTPVDLYILRVTELWGEAAPNHMIDQANSAAGFLQISPKVLQFSSPVTIVYGDELRFDATTDHGVLEGDSVQVVAEIQGAQDTTLIRPGAGTYTGVATELSGAQAGNYKLPEEAERVFAGLTISKRPLTVHVSDQSLTYGTNPQTVTIRVDNVVEGDERPTNFTFEVASVDGGTFMPFIERTGVGEYRLRVQNMPVHPNYTLAESGHTEGQLLITPRPLRYTTADWEMEYGAENPYLGWAEAVLNESDILPGDQVQPADVAVYRRELYPDRLPTDSKYPLALTALQGSHSDNYVIDHIDSTQGLLTVLPRELQLSKFALSYNGEGLASWSTWTFGDLETTYGFADGEDGGFLLELELSGVLQGDDVSAAVSTPKLDYSSHGYLAAGQYDWTLQGLTGDDSRNYVLVIESFNPSRVLEIRPRPVQLYVGYDGLTYGEQVPYVDVRFDESNQKFFNGAALDVANIAFWSSYHDTGLTWDDVWNGPPVRLPAGSYFTRVLDESEPFLIGRDAKNFEPRLSGSIEVERRTLRLTPPENESWIYGRSFTPSDLYGNVVGPNGTTGIIADDDVSVEYWVPGRGISRNNMDSPLDPTWEYSPAGEYAEFEFRLLGTDAANYELLQPNYTVTIAPRPLELPFDTLYPDDDGILAYTVEYMDEVRPDAGRHGGVMPRDAEDMFVGIRGDDGVVRPVHEMDAGLYDLNSVALTGRWAGNYELHGALSDGFLRINPRSLLFSIEDVIGQYGNFLACLDPMTCNGGPQGPHGDRYLWVPGLKLGDVELEGVLPGHDVTADSIILLDANGRTGRLEDVPPPGVYFQVVDGLTGKDAHNYQIAATGSRPGILTITPQWVRWETTDGIYMPETGFRSLNPDFDEDYELVEGLQSRATAATGELDLDPVFQFVGVNIDLWEETHIAHPRNLLPGNYYVEVAGFAEPFGFLYQPLPGSMSKRGILSVFADSRLGLESVDLIDDLEPPEGSSAPAAGPASSGASSGRRSGSDSSSFSGFGDEFGFNINREIFETAGVRGDAYVNALAEYGVTGVTLTVEAGVRVEYQIGKGYVEVGAEARARSEVGPTGVSASVRAGAKAGGGARGSLGGGVDGEAAGHVGVVAVAAGKAGLVFEDGNFTLGAKSHVGAGVSVGARGGLSWRGGSVDTGVTVYSPGTIGQNFSFGAGFSDSVLTINATLGLSLLFGGIELDLGFSIDLSGLQDAFESFACGSGIGMVDCSPSDLEIGEGLALAAKDISDPLQRFAFLNQNYEWRYIGGEIQAGRAVDPEVAIAYFENRFFFEQVQGVLSDLERYIAEQEEAQARFFHDLEEDPLSALHAARNLHSESGYFAQQARSIHQQLTALGIQLEIRRETVEGVGGQTVGRTFGTGEEVMWGIDGSSEGVMGGTGTAETVEGVTGALGTH